MTEEASTRNGSYTNTFAYDGGSYTGTQGAGDPTTFRGTTNSFNSDNQNESANYDGNGNETAFSSTILSYDPENRLTAYGTALSASYNGYGLRAVKTDSAGTTYYLYDGATPVVEENSSGTVTATNTFGANGLVSRTTGSSVFYTFDAQGNTAQRLDGSQSILTSDIYDSFGAGASSGTPTDPFGYGAQWGYYTDRSTGLILCTNRYYNPGQGQWLTRDPIGYDGGINLYGYVGNDPLDETDPMGLRARYRGQTGAHVGGRRGPYGNMKPLPPGAACPTKSAAPEPDASNVPRPASMENELNKPLDDDTQAGDLGPLANPCYAPHMSPTGDPGYLGGTPTPDCMNQWGAPGMNQPDRKPLPWWAQFGWQYADGSGPDLDADVKTANEARPIINTTPWWIQSLPVNNILGSL